MTKISKHFICRRVPRLESSLTLVSALLGVLFLVGSALAESAPKVYPGEYVVEYAFQAQGYEGPPPLPSTISSGESKSLGRSSALLTVTDPRRTAPLSTSALDAGDGAVGFDDDLDACKEILKDVSIKSCSPNYELRIMGEPNDPLFSGTWGLHSKQGGSFGPAAWDITTGNEEVVIAVIDTGVDFNHEDLKENMWVNSGEIAGNGIDDDGNGYVDDIHGYSAIGSSPLDDNGHGTHCAGTIGARGNNGIGVAGVNWKVKIMALKFLSATGAGSLASAIETINYMVVMKERGVNIRVSSNSWGGGAYNQPLHNAIKRANEAGIIFVAAAGNAGNDNDATAGYPSSYEVDNVVAVAAIGEDLNLASFSNYGATSVDIAAPGVDILSTYPGNKYRSLSGTSMATPHVAGALALLIGHDPSLTNAQVIQRLYESGDSLPSLSGVVRTGRTLNVSRLVGNLTAPIPTPTPVPAPCRYKIEEFVQSPDFSADDGELVQQADEFNYQSVVLPFAFPFHRELLTSVMVSPNGVLYAGSAPGGMDYRNGKTAPDQSIAVLHTDLSAPGNPYGVRVRADSQSATLFWRGTTYGGSGGDVEVRTTLFPDGKIEAFYNFTNKSVLSKVRKNYTIGLKGRTDSSAFTFLRNDRSLSDNLAVRFTPLCGEGGEGSEVEVSKILAYGFSSDGKLTRTARPGGELYVQLQGAGSGSVPVRAAINGKLCQNSISARLDNGEGEFVARLPRLGQNVRSLKLISGKSKRQVRLSGRRKGSRTQSRKQERKVIRQSCRKMLSSFEAARLVNK